MKPSIDDGGEALFKNTVMVGNWWEDRLLPAGVLSTAERTMAKDGTDSQSMSMTTKRQFDSNMMAQKAAVAAAYAKKKPSLYKNEVALKERLETYMPEGKPPTEITYTLGRTMVTEASQAPERYLNTTNNHFYKELPEQARRADPSATSTPLDRTHFRTSMMEKELAKSQHVTETGEPLGSKGSRGEITRHPREAGNPYGVQVFVDEYAQWGNKLSGKMTLGDTVARKMTSYF